MLWYEELELLFELLAKVAGSSFELNYSEATGYYCAIKVFGEPEKSFCGKDYSNKAYAISCALEHVQDWE